jgi:ribokinase
MNKILVIGSSNTDLIAQMERFPAAGETVEGNRFLQAMGGKGANQALAAHKLGGNVEFITCLGNDANGENSLSYYKKEGLNVAESRVVEGIPSGTAMIWVDGKGENCIVITPGANKELSPEYIATKKETFGSADILLMQMEIPYETVEKVCEIASETGKKVMLNVAPACKIEKEVIKKVDILIVNETEAEVIAGEKIAVAGEKNIVEKLLALGAKTVVLTLGKNGCIMKGNSRFFEVPAFSVKAVDSTAAGDTFCGALAAELSREHPWPDALRFASAAAAICVTRMGAQPSIPTEKEVREFLKDQK